MNRFTKFLLIGGGVAAFAAVAVLADRTLVGGGRVQDTNDAYVAADYSIVAPKIAGLIDRVAVDDNQRVVAGQLLAHIDDRDEANAVAIAGADLAAAQADIGNLDAELARQGPVIDQADATIQADDAALAFARADAARYRNLSAGGAGTVQQQQQSESQARQALAARARDQASVEAARRQIAILQAQRGRAEAALLRARAGLDQAKLNLSYTRIVAPIAGVVGSRSVRVGNYVNAGSPLLAVVPLDQAYVLADFQETQLTHMRPGQTARVTVDGFPGTVLTGRVDSVAPASGVTFSVVAPDNATGNFTKVVQRLPVKIVLDRNGSGQVPEVLRELRVGMSVEASVDTDPVRTAS